jgi:hypothetical protein
MVKFDQLKQGEKLSESQFYTVAKVGKEKVMVENDKGEPIVLDKKYVESCLVSSCQYSEEKTITRTEAAALFIASTNTAMTVNFNTQVKEKEAKEAMYEMYPNKGKMISEADFKKKIDATIKSIITGDERTMVGRHYGSVNDFGRVNFIDMEIKADSSKDFDSRMRQVDPRSINWMIIKGIKYKVKK